MKAHLRQILKKNTNNVTIAQRATHTYVVGQPGTGKSRAIESWVMQDIGFGHGVGVIDPHGELFNNLLYRLSTKPEVWERVVIIDPCDPKWVVQFNPLQATDQFSPQRLSLFLTDVMVKIWKLETATSPRLIWLLTNCFLALSNLGLNLVDLPDFLFNRARRDDLIEGLDNPEVRSFFQHEFPKSQGATHQWITPVLNKIGGLIFDPEIRLMLTGESTINFRGIMDKKMILLVHLPKGLIGEEPSALLGAFIVAHLQKAALSRTSSNHRPPFYLYLDEFQNYTTSNIEDILSESRKYALSLTLAHQYLGQLSPELRSAVINTAGTLVCFRVGHQDASHLAKEIFPDPYFLARTETRYRLSRFAGVPFLRFQEDRNKLGWDGLANLLTKLPARTFWSKRRGGYAPVRQRTHDMPDPSRNSAAKARVRELLDDSGKRHGKLKQTVRRETSNHKDRDGLNIGIEQPGAQGKNVEPSQSLWSD